MRTIAQWLETSLSSHTASQISSVLTWVALQCHLMSYLHVFSVPVPHNTQAPRNFEWVVFSSSLWDERAILSLLQMRHKRQALAFQRYFIPLMACITFLLKGNHVFHSTRSGTKPSTALTGNVIRWHRVSPVHKYLPWLAVSSAVFPSALVFTHFVKVAPSSCTNSGFFCLQHQSMYPFSSNH